MEDYFKRKGLHKIIDRPILISSFISTIKKRRLNLLDSIKNIFEGTPVLS